MSASNITATTRSAVASISATTRAQIAASIRPNILAYTLLPNGIKVLSRSAGPLTAPVILLLHGFPTSSHQYRNLIPLLSQRYHVIAPDLPGFGFTEVPPSLNFNYTFANLTNTISAFLDALHIFKFSLYIFNYGAPIGLRLALQRPDLTIQAIVSQNGNAYYEGIGQEFWAPLFAYWKASSSSSPSTSEIGEHLRSGVLTVDHVKEQYLKDTGSFSALVAPETWTLDYTLLCRPGNKDIQLALFEDYTSNVDFYPAFQTWFRQSKIPLLAVWGRNDIIFVKEGAEAFRRDLEGAEVRFVDGGHFALETHGREVAEYILEFLARKGI